MQIHSCLTHNSKNLLEIVQQVSVGEQVDKLWDIGTSRVNNNTNTTDTCHNMDEFPNHTKWREPDARSVDCTIAFI